MLALCFKEARWLNACNAPAVTAAVPGSYPASHQLTASSVGPWRDCQLKWFSTVAGGPLWDGRVTWHIKGFPDISLVGRSEQWTVDWTPPIYTQYLSQFLLKDAEHTLSKYM